MRELTPEEKTFIDQNHDKLKPREMAAGLRISNELVRGYMHYQGYRSICYVNPRRPLNDKEKEEIRNNCAAMTINQLAIKLRRPFNTVKRFADAKRLPYKLTASGRPRQDHKRIPKPYTPPKIISYVQAKIIRHPAVYSNTDWQKYGEEILNR